jgi:3-methyladenine DNA glycosylase Tag
VTTLLHSAPVSVIVNAEALRDFETAVGQFAGFLEGVARQTREHADDPELVARYSVLAEQKAREVHQKLGVWLEAKGGQRG